MKPLTYENAEAELVGHVIILGITVLAISIIVVYGVPAILSLQDTANLKNAEQTFAVLDSRASRTVLGDSPLQTTNVNLGGGTLTVVPNSNTNPSYIVVSSPPVSAITIDTSTNKSIGAASSMTWSHTVGSGLSNSLLVVGVDISKDVPAKVTSITYAGVNLALAAFVVGAQNTRAEIWYLTNPQAGANNIVVTFNTTLGPKGAVAGAVSLSGVDQTNPIPTTATGGGGGTPSTSITTANAYAWIIDTYSVDAGTTDNPTSPQTAIWNLISGSGMAGGGSTKTTTTAGSYTMSWSGSSGSWAQVVAEIKPVLGTYVNFIIPMGKVEYQLGNRIVASEGGGVWSKYPYGSVMLSRPEFNYNGWTLTLPVFNISGSDSVGGEGTAVVSFKKNPPLVIFPNTSRPDWANRTNPVNYMVVGKVYVNITSDFYDAWAGYLGTVSSAKIVSEDPRNHTTSIALTVYPGYVGVLNYYLTDPIVFRGLDPTNSTPLSNFSFTIYSDDKHGNWQDIKWDIAAMFGTRTLIFYINGKDLWIGYRDTTYNKPAETWGKYTYSIQTDTNGNQYISVDLLNKSINLTYQSQDVGPDNGGVGNGCYINKIKGSDFNTSGFSWSDIPFSPGTTNKSIYDITQHYIQLMASGGDITFGQCGAGSKIPNPTSTMYINYYAPGGLTYLHITDNKANVVIR